jgi:hypothetical protein
MTIEFLKSCHPKVVAFLLKGKLQSNGFPNGDITVKYPTLSSPFFQCRHGIECLNDTMRYIHCPGNTDMRKDPSRDNFIYRLPMMVDW